MFGSRLRARQMGVAALAAVVWLLATSAMADVRVRWTRQFGAIASAVSTSQGGRTAVTGSTRIGPGGVMLVRMFEAGGTVPWSKTWRPTTDSWTYGVGIDIGPAGRVFVVGDVWTPIDPDAQTSWFVRAYTRGGRLLWSRLAQGWREQSASAGAGGVAAWRNGAVLAGSTCGEGGCEGGWLRSFALDGSMRWFRWVGGPHGHAEDVAVRASGTAYVTGAFNATSLPPGEGDAPFVTKVRSDGTKAWTFRFKEIKGWATAIAVRRGGVVVGGVTSSGASSWLASVRDDGSLRWIRSWRRERVADLDVTPSGWIWVTGRVSQADGHPALFLHTYLPDGTRTNSWLRDPAGFAARGTGVSFDPLGVSVGGWWDRSGRLWRLST